MKINNIEIDFRISKLTDAGNLEVALKKMEESEKKIKVKTDKNASLLEVVKDTLSMLRQFFEDTTGVDVLSDCDDVDDAMRIYYEFLDEIQKQKKNFIKPYSPERVK